MHRRLRAVVRCVLTGGLSAGIASAADIPGAELEIAKLPLRFEANLGQQPADVRFLARTPDYVLHLTVAEAVLSPPGGGRSVTIRVVGGLPSGPPRGEDPQGGASHDLIGNDPAAWVTNVPSYARVLYRAILPGIDLVFRGRGPQVELDFVVAPRSRPGATSRAPAWTRRVTPRWRGPRHRSITRRRRGPSRRRLSAPPRT